MKIKRKILIMLSIIILLVIIKTKVEAKSYYINDMDIQSTILENGDLEIEQTMEYSFNR